MKYLFAFYYRKFDFNIENNCYDLNQVINIINVIQL